MIKGFGYDEAGNFHKLSEVSLTCDKKDLRSLRSFLDKCIEEMDKGKFTGENGGHRHYQDFKEEGLLINECDFIILLNHKGKKNV